MEYFCSNNGVNISSDINNPGNFIETLSCIFPGDIIYLLPGEYFFDKTINIKCNGNQFKHICIKGFLNNEPFNEHEYVIFNFKNLPYICNDYDRDKTQYYCDNGNGVNVYGNYIEFINITIKFSAFRGLENFGNYNIFDNITTSYNCDSGHVQSGCNNIIKNCYSHHNFDYRFIKNGEIMYGFNSDGFSDKLHTGNSNTYINCISSFNGDDGFDFFQRENTENDPSIIKNSVASNNGGEYIDMSMNERLLNDKDYYNKYDLTKYPNYGNGNGFKLGGIHKTSPKGYINYHYANLYNCISIYNYKHGINGNHTSGIIKLYNCISSLNKEVNYIFMTRDNAIVICNNCYSYPEWNVKINENNTL